jgi:predicted DNA-binding transcriptional regulator YafY
LELSIVLEKIENLIPENTKDEMIKNDYIIFDVGGWDNSSKQSTKMQEIYEVIKKNQLIEIEYSDSKGIISIRVIEPMTLVLKGFAWYLFAFCREKNDFRMFKILRIKKLIILELFFERKEKEYKEINCHWNPRNMQEITLKFDAKMKFAVKEYFKRGKITKNDDGFIIVLINAPIDNWLIGLILSYGQFVEVLKPSSLREEIKNRISKTMEIYKK